MRNKSILRELLSSTFLLAMSVLTFAQQKIGSNPGSLNPGAILELESTNRGFLLPRVDLGTSPTTFGLNGGLTLNSNGMIVYNTNTTLGVGYYVWSGTTGTVAAPTGGAWSRIFTGATSNSLAFSGSVLTSTVNGTAATVALPSASSTATGLLSSTDWNAFNNKQGALTVSNGLTLSGSALRLGGTLTSATTIDQSTFAMNFGGTGALNLNSGNVTINGTGGYAPLVVKNGSTANQVVSVLANSASGDPLFFLSSMSGVTTNNGGDRIFSFGSNYFGADGTGIPNDTISAGLNFYRNAINVKTGGLGIATGGMDRISVGDDGVVAVNGLANSLTSRLRLPNFASTNTAIAGLTGTASQLVLGVDASGNVVLRRDFGTANAGTVTSVSGTSPITVGGTTAAPVIGIDQSVLSLGSIGGTLPLAKLTVGTSGQILQMSAGTGTTPTWVTPTTANSLNIYTTDGTLAGARTVTQNANTLTFSGTGYLNKFSNSTASPAALTVGRTSTEAEFGIAGGTGQGFTATSAGDVWLKSNIAGGGLFLGTAGTGAELHLMTNNAERMVITPGGDVGITGLSGTGIRLVTASATGVVSTQAAGTSGQILQMSAGTTTTPTWVTPSAANSQNIYTTNGTLTGPRSISMGTTVANQFTMAFDTTTLVINPTTNRIGIGTASPERVLHTFGDGVRFDRNGGSGGTNAMPAAMFVNTDGTNIWKNWSVGMANTTMDFAITDVGNLAGGTPGTQRLVINGNTGNVGIGTSSPSQKLHVDGGALISSLSGTGIRLVTASATGVLSTTLTAGTSGQILQMSAGTTTTPTWVTPSATNSQNIYTTDGTLTQNRTVSIDSASTLTLAIKAATKSTAAESLPILRLRRDGVMNLSYQQNVEFSIGKYLIGGTTTTDANTQFDIRLNNGQTNDVSDSPVMSLRGNGNVGIGIEAPSQKLHVAGGALISSLSGTGIRMVTASSAGVLSVQSMLDLSNISGTLPLAKLTVGTSGQILQMSGGTTTTPTWVTPSATNSQNIYTTNGTLTGPRSISMGTTVANQFTMAFDTTTLVVDAKINKIGIGVIPNTNTRRLQIAGGNGDGIGIGNWYDSNVGYAQLRTDNSGNGVLELRTSGNDNATQFVATGNSYLGVNGGNFGIGTISPSQKLHVDGGALISSLSGTGIRLVTASATGVVSTQAVGTSGQILQMSAGTATTPTWVTPSATNSQNIYTTDGTLGNNRIVGQGDFNLQFTNGTGKTIFGSFGNATTANNTATLGFAGRLAAITDRDSRPAFSVMNDSTSAIGNRAEIAFRTQGSLTGFGNAASIAAIQTNAATAATDLFFATYSGTANTTERMRITGGGNVGIGTSDPTSRLHVAGGSILFDNLNNRGKDLQITTGHRTGASNPRIISNDTLELQVVGTPHLLVMYAGTTAHPNGRVSIGSYGTTSTALPIATSTLDVNGSISYAIRKITQTTGTGLVAGSRTVGASDRTVLVNTFANTAGIEIILPEPSTCSGREYLIRKVDESSNAVTFTFTGITNTNAIRVSDTSASAGAYINSLNYMKTLRIQSDGTDWVLID